MPARKISIAICTRNRARLLAGALESLCLAHVPRQLDWEVIVVLNDCHDGSRAVVDAFLERLPIVLACEPRAGLSYARNKAIDTASGDLVVWIDDDVRVSADWLCEYERAFLQCESASFFGGPILPRFEGTPPRWLQQHWDLCETAYAVRRVHDGNPEITPATKLRPFGANFAVRTDVQRRHRYDLRLGRRPGKQVWGGEETKVIGDMLAAGERGRWVWSACVHHVLPQERQTPHYLRSYYQSYGIRAGLRSRQHAEQSRSPADLPSLVDVVRAELRFRWLRVVANPDRWIPALKRAARTRGKWLARYHGDGVPIVSGDGKSADERRAADPR